MLHVCTAAGCKEPLEVLLHCLAGLRFPQTQNSTTAEGRHPSRFSEIHFCCLLGDYFHRHSYAIASSSSLRPSHLGLASRSACPWDQIIEHPQTIATTSSISLGSTSPIISASDVLRLLPQFPSLLNPQQPLDFVSCCPSPFHV